MNTIFGHWDKAKERYFQIMILDVVIKSVMDHERNWGLYPGPHKDWLITLWYDQQAETHLGQVIRLTND